MNQEFYVTYKVSGYGERTLKAGPYSEAEIQYQYNDIKGFEGIFDCKIVPSLVYSVGKED